jgi:hypothetical protein
MHDASLYKIYNTPLPSRPFVLLRRGFLGGFCMLEIAFGSTTHPLPLPASERLQPPCAS